MKSKALTHKKLRIGIYAGAFDPVHAGHVAFALQALRAAKLDQIIFLPERRPRHKPSVEHYAHRIAMLKSALAPHQALAVMEVVDKQFSVRRTLPQLRGLFPQAQLVMLIGSDALPQIPSWPYAYRLLETCELVVGIRAGTAADITHITQLWEVPPKALTIFDSFAPDVSSSKVRHALRTRQYTTGLLASVRSYAHREWLYVSPHYGSL